MQAPSDRAPGIERGNRSYPIWVDSERPITEIERELQGWLKAPKSSPLIRQLALRSLVTFEGLLHDRETTRRKEIHDARDQKEAAPIEDEAETEPVGTPLRAATGRAWAAFWVTIGQRRYRPIIGPLYVAAKGFARKDAALSAVVKRCSEQDDPEMSRIAKLLSRALKIVRWI